MALQLGLFIFCAIGVKFVLAVWAIWLLLPSDAACPNCDHETLALTDPPGLGLVWRALRLRRRWCPRCGRPCLARRGRELRVRTARESDRRTAPYA